MADAFSVWGRLADRYNLSTSSALADLRALMADQLALTRDQAEAFRRLLDDPRVREELLAFLEAVEGRERQVTRRTRP